MSNRVLKSSQSLKIVIPAKAGIHDFVGFLDVRLHGHDVFQQPAKDDFAEIVVNEASGDAQFAATDDGSWMRL